MVDSSKHFSLVRGRRMRLTKLDSCGNVVLGPTSQVVSDGFISVGLTANTEEGETISVTNAAGNICILDAPAPRFSNYGVEIAFCGVNPDAINLTTGQEVVYDSQSTPQGVGFRVSSGVELTSVGFALELWTGVPSSSCSVNVSSQYGYFLLPFIGAGVVGDFTVENAAINFTVTGANSKDGTGWGVGPHNVTTNATGTPTPLRKSMSSRDHLHMELVSVSPPMSQNGASALGVPATGATAGAPGTFTPTNSYGPLTLAGMTGLTATPTAAWAVTEYVTLRDGSRSRWSGTAWVAA